MEIVLLLKEQVINENEFVLLGIINSLCRKKGCWASNTYLAKQWGDRNANWVSICLQRFKKLGLIKVEYKSSTGFTNRTIRTSFQGINPFRDSQNSVRGSRNSNRVGSRNSNTKYDKDNEYTRPAPAGPGEIGFGVSVQRELSKYVTKFAELSIQKRWFVGTKGSTKTGYKSQTLKQWDTAIRALRAQVGKTELKAVFRWYLLHAGEDFVPLCQTLPSFCRKFSQVRAAMQRHQKDYGEEENKPVITEVTEQDLKAMGLGKYPVIEDDED